MTWGETALRAEPRLSLTARELVVKVERYYATHGLSRCCFCDEEVAKLVGVSCAQIKAARAELEKRHFLRPLQQRRHNRPQYLLGKGYVTDSDEAA